MLNIHNLSVSFGGSYLFEEVTFRLGAGDRVGLVGKNGAGKSTMLKILARDFAPDSGSTVPSAEGASHTRAAPWRNGSWRKAVHSR